MAGLVVAGLTTWQYEGTTAKKKHEHRISYLTGGGLLMEGLEARPTGLALGGAGLLACLLGVAHPGPGYRPADDARRRHRGPKGPTPRGRPAPHVSLTPPPSQCSPLRKSAPPASGIPYPGAPWRARPAAPRNRGGLPDAGAPACRRACGGTGLPGLARGRRRSCRCGPARRGSISRTAG